MKRGEIWWARTWEPIVQLSKRADDQSWCGRVMPLIRALQSVLVVPLTTNLDRAHLAGTAVIDGHEEDGLETNNSYVF